MRLFSRIFGDEFLLLLDLKEVGDGEVEEGGDVGSDDGGDKGGEAEEEEEEVEQEVEEEGDEEEEEVEEEVEVAEGKVVSRSTHGLVALLPISSYRST